MNMIAPQRLRLVVVGNGMAGMRTVEEILARTPLRFQITVFGAEPHPNYNRIMLSPLLAKEKTFEDIVINSREWYEQNGIELITGERVWHVDRDTRVVSGEHGTTRPYDVLLLATGSNPFILPLVGRDLPGVIGFRDITDVETMLAAAAKGGNAVVIGGGLLGLEAANGLALSGMTVTVLHLNPTLMDRQLDATAGAMLRADLERRGIRILTEAHTKAIHGSETAVESVELNDGTILPANLVVMAVGIRPNTELGAATGLDVKRGIVVDDRMRTSDPSIFAVGECVEHRGLTYGLVAPLWDMAKVCADAITGVAVSEYEGSVTGTRLKVTGIDMYSAGDFAGGPGTEEVVFRDPARGVYRRLVLRGETLIGAVLYGDAKDGGWYFGLIRDVTPLGELRENLIFGQDVAMAASGADPNAALAAMAPEAEICGCNGVCKAKIVATIAEKGLTTLDEVRAHTKASASCGSCTPLVEGLLGLGLGETYTAPVGEKAMCKCTALGHDTVRAEIVAQNLKTIPDTMEHLGWLNADGCHTCRPALNYYLLCAWPGEYVDSAQSRFVNERMHANIQKDGTYSVVPRMWGGLTNSRELRAIADVVDKFAIPTVKVTGGQRIDLLGVKREDLPAVWRRPQRRRNGLRPRLRQSPSHRQNLRRQRMVPLRHPGQHRNGRNPRTHDLGQLVPPQGQARRLRMPPQLRRSIHQGLRRHRRRQRLGTECRRQRRHPPPRHRTPRQGHHRRRSPRILRRLPPAIPRGRPLPRTHRPLGRTPRHRMGPRALRRRRPQPPSPPRPLPPRPDLRPGRPLGRAPPRNRPRPALPHPGRGGVTNMDGMDIAAWTDIGALDDIPRQGARVVATRRGDVAIFRTLDDAVFALDDACPHKQGKLSQGIVHGHKVTCPLHNWVIGLEDGLAQAPDEGCVNRLRARIQDGRVLLDVT